HDRGDGAPGGLHGPGAAADGALPSRGTRSAHRRRSSGEGDRGAARMNLRTTAGAAVALFLAYACATTAPPPQQTEVLHGVASWYGQEFAGRTTANGEIFDPMLLTAAHRTMPFGTVVEVKNAKTNQTVRVRINDR